MGTGHGVTHFSGHPFSRGLNRLLREHGFDDFVEAPCAEFYAETMGRPSVLPSVYCRPLFIGLARFSRCWPGSNIGRVTGHRTLHLESFRTGRFVVFSVRPRPVHLGILSPELMRGVGSRAPGKDRPSCDGHFYLCEATRGSARCLPCLALALPCERETHHHVLTSPVASAST